MKKKIAVAIAIGFLIGLLLWVCGFSDEFLRFNRFLWVFVTDHLKTLLF